jgi:hypothetical protein
MRSLPPGAGHRGADRGGWAALPHPHPGVGTPAGIIRDLRESNRNAMEAEQLNQIENALQDLAARTAELRRYL